jgi:hypothetical protein
LLGRMLRDPKDGCRHQGGRRDSAESMDNVSCGRGWFRPVTPVHRGSALGCFLYRHNRTHWLSRRELAGNLDANGSPEARGAECKRGGCCLGPVRSQHHP